MALQLTGLSASPTAINSGGGTSTVTPVVTNPASTITVTGTDENGDSATATITVNPEAWSLSTDASLIVGGKAPKGVVVLSISGPGTITASGQSATVTAS